MSDELKAVSDLILFGIVGGFAALAIGFVLVLWPRPTLHDDDPGPAEIERRHARRLEERQEDLDVLEWARLMRYSQGRKQ